MRKKFLGICNWMYFAWFIICRKERPSYGWCARRAAMEISRFVFIVFFCLCVDSCIYIAKEHLNNIFKLFNVKRLSLVIYYYYNWPLEIDYTKKIKNRLALKVKECLVCVTLADSHRAYVWVSFYLLIKISSSSNMLQSKNYQSRPKPKTDYRFKKKKCSSNTLYYACVFIWKDR